MNIGIITTWMDRGAAFVSKAYKETLERGGHRVFIYVRGGEYYARDNKKWDLPNVTWSPRLHKTKLPLFHYYNWLKNNNIELVLFNEQRDYTAVDLTKRLNITTAAYVDYYTRDNYKNFLKYDLIFCNTKRHYSVFKDFKGVYYFPWGVDLSIFKYNPNQSDKVIFFHNSGMNTTKNKGRKGTDLLVKAFSKIEPNVSKLIIHSQLSISHYPEIQELMAVRDDIEFIEATTTSPGLYHLGNVYVYPTRLEGIGLTITEALATGLPVITTDEPPMNEFIKHESNGLLIKIKRREQKRYFWPYVEIDIDDLFIQMERIINDQRLFENLQTNSRKSVEINWNWEKNSNELIRIINHIKHSQLLNYNKTFVLKLYLIQIRDKILYIIYLLKNTLYRLKFIR